MSKDRAAVIIAGYPRSGTTLTYRILRRAPACGRALPEPVDGAFETAISVYMNPLIDFEALYQRPWPHWSQAIPDPGSFASFAAPFRAQPRWRAAFERLLTRSVFEDGVFERVWDDVDSLAVRGPVDPDRRVALRRAAMRMSLRRHVIRSFYEHQARAEGARVVLDKYPLHYVRLHELFVAMPEARAVLVHRHPVDVYDSMVRRARVEMTRGTPIGMLSWLVLAAPTFAADWCRSARASISAAARYGERVHQLSYESLVERPEATTERLISFAGLEAGYESAGQLTESPAEDRRFPFHSAVPQERDGDQRPGLDEADVTAILKGCSPEMDALGYG